MLCLQTAPSTRSSGAETFSRTDAKQSSVKERRERGSLAGEGGCDSREQSNEPGHLVGRATAAIDGPPAGDGIDDDYASDGRQPAPA